MTRVPPSDRTRDAIRKLLGQGTEGEPQSKLMRLAMRLIVEEALEGKTQDVLGRDHYERREGEQKGYRNGQREASLKTAEGEVRYAVPQLRDVDGSALQELREHWRDFLSKSAGTCVLPVICSASARY